MKHIRFAVIAMTIVSIAASTAGAATKFDALNAVAIPADAHELISRVDDVTRRVCGDDTHTLYYRSCSDDVNAFIKASLSVKKKRAFQAQRRASPGMFPASSYRLF